MKHHQFRAILFALILFAFACNGTTDVDTTQAALDEKIGNVEDTLNRSQDQLTAAPEESVQPEEELLAENFEETDVTEAPDYVQTEMKDVVLTRKTGVPNSDNNSNANSSSVNEDNFDLGAGDDGPGAGWGYGDAIERKIIELPTIYNPTDEKGIVSVRVKVASDGRVVGAEALTTHNTNTANPELLNSATKHARIFLFEADPDIFVSNQVIDIQFE